MSASSVRAVPRGPLVRREAWKLGLLAAAAAAVVMAVVVIADGRRSLFRNDAELYWLVARDPFADGSLFQSVEGFAEHYGVAYRFGRMLYPTLAWAVAGGTDGPALEWALMVVDVVAFGFASVFAAELVARGGAPAFRGLAVLLVPAMWFSCVLALAEPLVLALLLLTFLCVLASREASAMVVAAVLLLARESAALALLPLAWSAWRRHDRRALIGWALVPLPLLAWWTWLRVRVGEWPFLDPAVSRREAIDAPFLGVGDVIREGLRPAHVVAFALGATTVAVALWVWRRIPWFPISQAAVALALVVVVFGPNAWRHPGEAIRLMGPAQALVVLSLVVAPGGRVMGRSSAGLGSP